MVLGALGKALAGVKCPGGGQGGVTARRDQPLEVSLSQWSGAARATFPRAGMKSLFRESGALESFAGRIQRSTRAAHT